MSNPSTEAAQTLRKWQQYTLVSPYSRELGLEVRSATLERCIIGVAYQDILVGNPTTRVLHSGVITTLLDSCSGLAIFVRLKELRAMATLDLRIDHLKPATPGRDVLGTAHCYKLTSELAFVRGSAYHDIPDDPIATSVAIFMFTGTPSIRFDKPTP